MIFCSKNFVLPDNFSPNDIHFNFSCDLSSWSRSLELVYYYFLLKLDHHQFPTTNLFGLCPNSLDSTFSSFLLTLRMLLRFIAFVINALLYEAEGAFSTSLFENTLLVLPNFLLIMLPILVTKFMESLLTRFSIVNVLFITISLCFFSLVA